MTPKKIKLIKIVAENFMCYAHEEFDIFDITKIAAMNGKGKSTIMTIYNWVLFNCDCELKDNPVVRREVDGLPVDDMDTFAELTLDVDEKEVTLKKVQKRTYSKDGSSYKDDNKYFVNDVPKTLKDFNAYLDVDMGVFKMCSNINAFLNQKPAEMREYLFGLVENVTDIDIACSKAKLSELIPMLEKYSAEELSAMNKATKAKITKDLPILDGQIKEKERDIQIKQDTDVSDLELRRNSLKEQITDCVAKQTDDDKLLAEYDKASADILDLKFKQSDMVRKANEDNIKQRKQIENEVTDVKRKIDLLAKDIDVTSEEIERNNAVIGRYMLELQEARATWKKLKEMQFDEDEKTCKMCGQELPQDKIELLVENFENKKSSALQSETERGNKIKLLLDSKKESIVKLNEKVSEDKAESEKLEVKLKELESRLAALPSEIDVTGTEEYKALEQQIAEKEQAVYKANDISAVKAELKAQESDLRQQLSDCEKKLAESNTEKDEQRLEELRTEQRTQEQNKTNAEKILDLLDELDKAKNETLSDSINSHFSSVKWKLFELNKSGGYKSVCIPTVDGKSILTTMSNKGNRILGRVDICNSIQKISGINCPIFLDDSESLSSKNQKKVIDMVDSQLVMLIVNDSEKLEITEI